ncbi:MAG: carboxypeptidase regulatory-like domain-containing protein [Pirellulaceae bacterium]
MVKTVLFTRGWMALAFVGSVLLGGCAGPESEYPPTVPVEGTVTYQGQPLEGALVAFKRTDGKGAVGRTDAGGRFQLTTYTTNDGAEVGSYQVEIVKYEPAPEELPEGVTLPLKPEIPERYGKASTSQLEAEVTADGGSFTFDLK